MLDLPCARPIICDIVHERTIAPMESSAPQFQKQLSCIEELINTLNAAPDSVLSAKSRELAQALLELHGTGLERLLN